MWPPATRIRTKIVVPFSLLFVLVTALTSFISVKLVAGDLEDRLQQRIDRALEVVADRDFAINPSILAIMKRVIGADLVTYSEGGEVIASTLAPGDAELLAIVRAQAVAEELSPDQQAVREVAHAGSRWRITYRRPVVSPGAVVAAIFDTSQIARAKSAVGRTIGLFAVVIVVATSLLSHGIARGITSPVEQLVQHTRALAAGDLTRRAAVANGDEIGRLAAAFNEMAEQLRRLEEKVVHSEKLALTGQLAARVAHDVRNPLSAMRMHAQLLRERDPDLDRGRSLEIILGEADRIERVVQGLLDLARPAELELREGDVNEVLSAALAVFAAHFEHRKILLQKRLGEDLPPVALDRERLEQALLNVLQNAAEALVRGGTVWATTRHEDRGSEVVIEICDDGVGLDAASRDRVFDPFFSTKREGVGLGLVNTRNVVEKHGGAVELLPREERGTCAVITLPAAAGPRTG